MVAMVSKQPTQTAGNRRGDPIRGSKRKALTSETGKRGGIPAKKEEDWSFSWPSSLHVNVQQGLLLSNPQPEWPWARIWLFLIVLWHVNTKTKDRSQSCNSSVTELPEAFNVPRPTHNTSPCHFVITTVDTANDVLILLVWTKVAKNHRNYLIRRILLNLITGNLLPCECI